MTARPPEPASPQADPDVPDDPRAGGLDRRRVLRSGAVLGIAAAAGLPLAACGGGSSSVAADIPAAAPVPVAPARTAEPAVTPRTKSQLYRRGEGDVAVTEPVPTRTPAPTARATAEPVAPEPTAPSKSDGLSTARRRSAQPVVIGRTGEIPVGGGRVYDKQRIVVTQPRPGEYRSFDARCTHEGCLVSDCNGGTINCPCHKSSFSLEDGTVIDGPAKTPLPAKTIEVVDGEIHHKA